MAKNNPSETNQEKIGSSITVKAIPPEVMRELRKKQNRMKELKNVGKYSLSATIVKVLRELYKMD